MPVIKIRRMPLLEQIQKEPTRFSNSKNIGYDSWKIVHIYAKRWAAESVFPTIKRIFGDM